MLFLFAGRASPVGRGSKKILEFLFTLKKLIAEDPVVSNFMQVVFISNYGISILEKLVAAADISLHITTPGQEVNIVSNGISLAGQAI